MGLDWCLNRTDDEEASPLELLGAEKADLNKSDHLRIMDEIIDSHRETTQNGHPNKNYKSFWDQSRKELYKEMEGGILVETIPEDMKKALPSIGSIFSSISGVESFRGKRIQFCEHLLPTAVREAAFQDRSPEEMLAYADILETYMEDVDWEHVKELESSDSEDKQDYFPEVYHEAKAIKDAIEWLRFWAQYPVNLFAWY